MHLIHPIQTILPTIIANKSNISTMLKNRRWYSLNSKFRNLDNILRFSPGRKSALGPVLDNDPQTPPPKKKEPTIRFIEHTFQMILRRHFFFMRFFFFFKNI